MAWDDDTQHGGMFDGGIVEWGESTLVAGTVEVPTKMSKIEAAYALLDEDPLAATAFHCDRTITTGCVTFTCGNLDKGFSYMLIGQG